MAGRNEAQPERLAGETVGVPADSADQRQRMRIVERVGKRLIIGCGCGNYFFAVPGKAICDHCGTERDTDTMATGGDAAGR